MYILELIANDDYNILELIQSKASLHFCTCIISLQTKHLHYVILSLYRMCGINGILTDAMRHLDYNHAVRNIYVVHLI